MHWSVIGHEKQKAYIERLIEGAALPHAILFAGPEGVGKRTMAADTMTTLVPSGYQLDRRVLARERDEDGKAHTIPVEAVRTMKQWIALRPMGMHKVVIVDDADLLGGDAANTFLKLLEEPPAYAHLFLITSRPGAVMPTIASRCERLDFVPLSDDDMSAALSGCKLSTDDRKLLSAVAAGRPGTALRLATDKRLPRAAKAIAGLETALKAGITERLLAAKEFADADDTPEVVGWWLAWTRAKLVERPQLAPVAAGLLELHDTVADPAFNRRLALDRFFLGITLQK